MKIYIKVYLALITCFIVSATSAQNHQIMLYIGVDSAIINQFSSKELAIRIKTSTNRASVGETIQVPISNGQYSTAKLNPADSLVYLSFEMVNNSKNGTYQNLADPEWGPLFQVYLFQSGDSINMEIKKDGILSFSGRGSQRLNCQYEMNKTPYIGNGALHRIIQFSNMEQLEQKLYFQDLAICNGIQMRLNILKTYQSKLPVDVYNLLLLDIQGYAGYQNLYHLYLNGYQFPDQKNKDMLKKYYQDWIGKHKIEVINPVFMAKSAYYADMVLIREFAYFQIYHKQGSYQKGDSFKELFEVLKTKYSGIFRDKLLFLCFEQLNKYYSAESRLYVTEALNIIKSPLYHRLLSDWKNKQYAAFPFELQDAKGKTHRLSDYKGKLLVMDLWFTGCHPCAELNKSMLPIIQKFEHNPDIVFMTVSIDRSKDQWLKSVASGQYTSPGTVNLFTNGLGKNHPLIKNYNFTGLPKQLIINQQGELITSSPPRPDDSLSNTAQFIELLENNLKRN